MATKPRAAELNEELDDFDADGVTIGDNIEELEEEDEEKEEKKEEEFTTGEKTSFGENADGE